MPIKVFYNEGTAANPSAPSKACTIRPTPFIQISEEVLKNKEGNFGVTYNITLTGTLLADHGTPYAVKNDGDLFDFFDPSHVPSNRTGPYGQFDDTPLSSRSKPWRQQVENKKAIAMLSKQRALRALFARDGQKIELSDIFDESGSCITCYPRVVSIDFTEGPYVTTCEYTIVLQADYLLRGQFAEEQRYVDLEGTLVNVSGYDFIDEDVTIKNLLNSSGTFFIEDYSENWSLEADEATGESIFNPRAYRISHQLSATGKDVYDTDGKLYKAAWEQARDFCLTRIVNTPSGGASPDIADRRVNGPESELAYPNVFGKIGSGTVDLALSYGGFNLVRTEQIDKTNGTYSVSENWLLSSGSSTETFNMSTSTSTSDPFVTVQLDGAIKGLSQIQPGVSGYGKPEIMEVSGAYANALSKYNAVSNSGNFGLTSDLYKRANNQVAVQLNSQPTSLSISTNQYTGEIGYNLTFNNRPVNVISGVIAENIQVNDTYPGDIFATIPVLGRPTGPILQYIGGRTEYRRDISVSLTMDYTKIPYSGDRTLLLKKPSLVEPTASQISKLIRDLSPQGEPGVRKYFVSPPTESWTPKEGSYSFNISFTYELDK